MKKSVLTHCILLFFVLFSCKKEQNKPQTFCEEADINIINCMNLEPPEDSYNYPVLPGMEAWKDFKSTAEMVEACQVPMDTLNRMSTDAIFQALWEYPFFYEIVVRSGYYQQDFETVFGNNKAYNVFVKRNDASEILYNRLKFVEPVCPAACKIYSKGLELFISQSVFLSKLSYRQKQEIVSISLKNDELRQINYGYKTYATREVTMLLLARILYSANYQPFVDEVDDKMNTFISTSLIKVKTKEEYEAFIKKIIFNAKKFINR